MKKRTIRRLVIAVLAIVLVWVLAGCSLFGVSKEARIDQFLSDLNAADRSDAYLNFSPDCADYIGLDGPYFDGYFPPGNRDYHLADLDFGANPVTGTITDDGVTFSLAGSAIEFTMVQDGTDWLISVLWIDGLGYVVQ